MVPVVPRFKMRQNIDSVSITDPFKSWVSIRHKTWQETTKGSCIIPTNATFSENSDFGFIMVIYGFFLVFSSI